MTEAPLATLDFFLLERYLLYSYRQRSKQLFRGQVHHEPYRYTGLQIEAFSTLPISWNGLPPVEGDPVHACLAKRVDVDVFGIEAL